MSRTASTSASASASEWNKMDPAKLWVISEHKIAIAEQVINF